jgi:hypothetical protein
MKPEQNTTWRIVPLISSYIFIQDKALLSLSSICTPFRPSYYSSTCSIFLLVLFFCYPRIRLKSVPTSLLSFEWSPSGQYTKPNSGSLSSNLLRWVSHFSLHVRLLYFLNTFNFFRVSSGFDFICSSRLCNLTNSSVLCDRNILKQIL